MTLTESDVASELDFWSNALIMYVLGEELSMKAVKQFIGNVWNFVTMPEIYYNDDGYFLLRFRSKIDKDAVMSKGPYTIYRQPMFLKEWSSDFVLKEDMLRVLCFPNYHWRFGGKQALVRFLVFWANM